MDEGEARQKESVKNKIIIKRIGSSLSYLISYNHRFVIISKIYHRDNYVFLKEEKTILK